MKCHPRNDDRDKVKMTKTIEAIDNMLTFSIGYFPFKVNTDHAGYEEGDEKAPFFSETYLYNLMGKDGARTVLSYIRKLCDIVGIDKERLP